MLEAMQYKDNSFITLTYDENNLPADGSLRIKDVQDWLKRLRFSIQPRRVRYFAVGEYGDTTFRPHYHVAMFNYATCRFGTSRYAETIGNFATKRSSCCASCDHVLATWGRGLVSLGVLNNSTAAYIAGYVTKKMTHRSDPRLNGKEPEFARMSLWPGIGRAALAPVAAQLLYYKLDSKIADVPLGLRHGTIVKPLGRYLRSNLRALIGREKNAPVSTQIQKSVELLALQKSAVANSRSIKEEAIAQNKTKVDTMLNRATIFKTKRTI